MTHTRSDDLFPEARNPEGTQVINGRCFLLTQDGHRVVLVSGIPLAQYAVGDRMSEANAMVSLIDLGWADQNDVANAFGYSVRTVRRHQARFAEGGLAALGRPNGYPSGRARLKASRREQIQHLKAQGCSHYEIARRLGVSVRAVRKTLRRLGWKPVALAQTELPLALPSAAHPKQPPVQVHSSSDLTASGGGPKPVRFFYLGCAELASAQPRHRSD